MKMAGSSWSTLLLSKISYQRSVIEDLLSKIDSACAASLEVFSKQTPRQLGLGQIRGPSCLADTPRPRTTGRYLHCRRRAGYVSVMRGTGDCDEKGWKADRKMEHRLLTDRCCGCAEIRSYRKFRAVREGENPILSKSAGAG